MNVRDDYLDKLYLEIMDIIGENYTGTIQKASVVSEEIVLRAEELFEEEYINTGEYED